MAKEYLIDEEIRNDYINALKLYNIKDTFIYQEDLLLRQQQLKKDERDKRIKKRR